MPVVIDAATAGASLDFARLIPALREAFVVGANAPLRHAHRLDAPGASVLIMPAWRGQDLMGIKIVTVFPGNSARGINAVHSSYLLSDAATGTPLALIDGNEITGRRTVAASALAGSYLARPDAARLLVVGSGHIASMLAPAWAAVRPIREVRVWSPRPARAAALAERLRSCGLDATAAEDLEAEARAADIISCATLSETPLIRGGWLRPGTHLDLIGGFRPTMREADDDAVRRARVYIDGEAALVEAGDLTQPLACGVLARDAVAGDLAALCRGTVPGRGDAGEITLFKSVGTALEDLAAAALVWADHPAATRS